GGDGTAAEVDSLAGEEGVHPSAQRVVGCFPQVIAGLESGEGPQPARQPRQRVEVDEPAVATVLEIVMHGGTPQVSDPGAVDGRTHTVAASAARHRSVCCVRGFHTLYSERADTRMGGGQTG